MKKIVPFKKEIVFKTNLSEVTSISLEHTLQVVSEDITGEFVITGEYKMTDTSINTEAFSFNLPFSITMDDHYILNNVVVDIDDFYYEIINNNTLVVNIEVLIDKLEEKKLAVIEDLEEIDEEEILEDVKYPFLEIDESIPVFRKGEDIKEEERVEATTEIKTLFDNLDNDAETYITYRVCIIREGDNLESIIQKYGISKEELENYNELSEIKIGDKIIIPALTNAKV